MDQRRLVERAREGDHDAFAELVRAAVVRLDRAARLILRDPELARDAVQEGLIRAWRDLPGLREPERFDAWLHRLTVNACLDIARRRRRRAFEVVLAPFHARSLYVARSDGRDVVRVTPEAISLATNSGGSPDQFSPDGRSIAIAAIRAGGPGILLAAADGSGAR